jgi:uncharacterized protein (DUF1800 family)
MLLAVEQHPAMLLYLDNQQSMGPNSELARRASRRGRDLGLNENLGREILELHTLGVDGGYTQQDVRALATMITAVSRARSSSAPPSMNRARSGCWDGAMPRMAWRRAPRRCATWPSTRAPRAM